MGGDENLKKDLAWPLVKKFIHMGISQENISYDMKNKKKQKYSILQNYWQSKPNLLNSLLAVYSGVDPGFLERGSYV